MQRGLTTESCAGWPMSPGRGLVWWRPTARRQVCGGPPSGAAWTYGLLMSVWEATLK